MIWKPTEDSAKQELKAEEAAKEAALKEEEFDKMYQERLHFQEQSEKNEAARRAKRAKDNLDHLKKNMVRYGLEDGTIKTILRHFPPPPPLETCYSEEFVREQDEWYRNTLKGALLEAGLEGGEADAVIHDTNDMMCIDGVRTCVTRMLDTWLSERILRRYRIPYMRDPVCPLGLLSVPSSDFFACLSGFSPHSRQQYFSLHNRTKSPSSSSSAGSRSTRRSFSGTTRASYAIPTKATTFSARRSRHTGGSAASIPPDPATATAAPSPPPSATRSSAAGA